MTYQGVLTKMDSEFQHPIQYYLELEEDFLIVNQLLHKTISIKFISYQCLNCRKEKPIYRQGYCSACFFKIPEAADWIIRPELSMAHLDKEDRDLTFEKKIQLQPHIVYLANSGGVKVGVTRKSQIPYRWIDQGAHEALAILETPNRYLAGITEVALKEHVNDKTNWRKMLKTQSGNDDLLVWKDTLKNHIPHEAKAYFIESCLKTELEFPVIKYPNKPQSLNLKKTPYFQGILKGIKGQYLIFDDDTVFNIRSNEGSVIQLGVTH